MSQKRRIIARLDIKGANLVKGINLEGLRVIGLPEKFANQYYVDDVDEIFFQDIVASLFGRNNILEVVERTAKNIFIPLTVGGGLRNITDISNALRSGADKVSINTALFEDLNFLKKSTKIFGSSTISCSVEIIKNENNEYYAYTDNGRNYTGKEALDWIKFLQDEGAGEINVTFVNSEGTGKGVDVDFVNKLEKILSIPLLIHGGFGNIRQIFDFLVLTSSSSIVLASTLHYNYIHKFNKNSINTGNTDYIKSNKNNSLINPFSILELKKFLKINGVNSIRYSK